MFKLQLFFFTKDFKIAFSVKLSFSPYYFHVNNIFFGFSQKSIIYLKSGNVVVIIAL